jgi:hypothetical protein
MSNVETGSDEIGFAGNQLLVDGKRMRAHELDGLAEGERWVEAGELDRTLARGRYVILKVIEEEWQRRRERETNPDVEVSRPRIQSVRLGSVNQQDEVVSDVGGGIVENRRDVHDRFHPYWDAVRNNGFTPDVRPLKFGSPELSGAWLFAGKPEYDRLAAELGFRDTSKLRKMRSAFEVREWLGERLSLGKEWLREYRIEGEEIVDAMWGDAEQRARAQIGLILTCAERKRSLGDMDGFMEEVDDALTYARNLDDPVLVRMIENGAWQSD